MDTSSNLFIVVVAIVSVTLAVSIVKWMVVRYKFKRGHADREDVSIDRANGSTPTIPYDDGEPAVRRDRYSDDIQKRTG